MTRMRTIIPTVRRATTASTGIIFAPSGKKYCTSTGDEEGEYRVSRIDGKYYCFDSTGKMQTHWVYMDGDPDSASSNTIEHWRYFAEPEIKKCQ